MKSILSYFTSHSPSGITSSSQSIAEPSFREIAHKNVLEDTEPREELVDEPEGIDKANNAKRRRMSTEVHSAETGQVTTAQLVEEIPSVSLSASDINAHLSSEDYSTGAASKECEGVCCIDDTVPYQPTEASVLAKTKIIYGDGKSKRERSFQEYWYRSFKWLVLCTTRMKAFCFYCRFSTSRRLVLFSSKAE